MSEEHIDQCILHLGVLALHFLRTSSDRGQGPEPDNLIWPPFTHPFVSGSAEHDRTFCQVKLSVGALTGTSLTC